MQNQAALEANTHTCVYTCHAWLHTRVCAQHVKVLLTLCELLNPSGVCLQQMVCAAPQSSGCVWVTRAGTSIKLFCAFPCSFDDQMPLKFCCCSLIITSLLSQTQSPGSLTITQALPSPFFPSHHPIPTVTSVNATGFVTQETLSKHLASFP